VLTFFFTKCDLENLKQRCFGHRPSHEHLVALCFFRAKYALVNHSVTSWLLSLIKILWQVRFCGRPDLDSYQDRWPILLRFWKARAGFTG